MYSKNSQQGQVMGMGMAVSGPLVLVAILGAAGAGAWYFQKYLRNRLTRSDSGEDSDSDDAPDRSEADS